MYRLNGKVVVVTGAGSGIGRALAQQLAAKGCVLALADIDAAGLADTAAGLPQPVLSQQLDVADRAAVYAFAERVKRELGAAHVIINNAGVALSRTIEDLDYPDFEWLMNINFWGVVHGSKAFLPQLRERGEGAVVNLSSIFGIIAVPTQGAYHAAKFAVRGFTECLRQELRGSGINAISVHPGGIKTNIVLNARAQDSTPASRTEAHERFQRMARTTAATAAAVIIQGIERERGRVLIGADAKLMERLQRWAPTAYPALLGRLFPKADARPD